MTPADKKRLINNLEEALADTNVDGWCFVAASDLEMALDILEGVGSAKRPAYTQTSRFECPKCHVHEDGRVTDVRLHENDIWRTRMCKKCGCRFRTSEVITEIAKERKRKC